MENLQGFLAEKEKRKEKKNQLKVEKWVSNTLPVFSLRIKFREKPGDIQRRGQDRQWEKEFFS